MKEVIKMNPSNQQTNGAMTQPPTMISSKDLLYLTDMMSWNLTAAKKARFLAEACQIQEIKQAIEETAHMHQNHYQRLLNYTQSQTNQTTH